MTEVQLSPQLECLRCHHKWIPRQKEVRICPHCKSAYWDRPKRTDPTPLDKADKIYARPGADHYHRSRKCVLLRGKDFDRLGYEETTPEQVKKRKLQPCVCACKTDTPLGAKW